MAFDKRLLYEIAKNYYELDKTQSEIASSLGISRSQVSRALKQAKDEGIVVVKLIPPGLDFADLEEKLRSTFGLSDAVVISGKAGPSRLLTQNLGMAGANYLDRELRPGQVIGVSWGATLRELVAALGSIKPEPREIMAIPLLGGQGQASPDLQVNDIASRVAMAFGGSHLYLHAPSFVDTPEARNMMMNDSNIRNVASKWAAADVAVVGVGCFVPPSTLLEEGGFPPDELEDLVRMGVVGDICMRFFDEQGQPVDTPLGDRIIGASLDQLRAIDCVVAVAGGVNKAASILGALRTGVVDVLITDDLTARRVLEIS
ncbi:MAG TPA: sugar-binding transcriptional regulator [Bacillota bacterium]|jgi:deoxyribonucleoside regulator|nr:sugar-binding transcriptional regulator [Bacillota bacterium]HOO31102.1 sugar-binding transcriptional regulator [Bacillota bacterium]HPZ13678.1 sugar-binding transcriptional regulator [Bacillota bacterium]HQD80569.1 sugar-binding transcriptional regulator [Bacillota bacterium]